MAKRWKPGKQHNRNHLFTRSHGGGALLLLDGGAELQQPGLQRRQRAPATAAASVLILGVLLQLLLGVGLRLRPQQQLTRRRQPLPQLADRLGVQSLIEGDHINETSSA